MKTFACRDVGVDCDWTTTGKSQEEVLKQVQQHARECHNMQQIPEDLRQKVLSSIRDKKVA